MDQHSGHSDSKRIFQRIKGVKLWFWAAVIFLALAVGPGVYESVRPLAPPHTPSHQEKINDATKMPLKESPIARPSIGSPKETSKQNPQTEVPSGNDDSVSLFNTLTQFKDSTVPQLPLRPPGQAKTLITDELYESLVLEESVKDSLNAKFLELLRAVELYDLERERLGLEDAMNRLSAIMNLLDAVNQILDEGIKKAVESNPPVDVYSVALLKIQNALSRYSSSLSSWQHVARADAHARDGDWETAAIIARENVKSWNMEVYCLRKSGVVKGFPHIAFRSAERFYVEGCYEPLKKSIKNLFGPDRSSRNHYTGL